MVSTSAVADILIWLKQGVSPPLARRPSASPHHPPHSPQPADLRQNDDDRRSRRRRNRFSLNPIVSRRQHPDQTTLSLSTVGVDDVDTANQPIDNAQPAEDPRSRRRRNRFSLPVTVSRRQDNAFTQSTPNDPTSPSDDVDVANQPIDSSQLTEDNSGRRRRNRFSLPVTVTRRQDRRISVQTIASTSSAPNRPTSPFDEIASDDVLDDDFVIMDPTSPIQPHPESSPPLRQSTAGILGSFLRARPRGTSHSHAAPPNVPLASNPIDPSRNSPPPPLAPLNTTGSVGMLNPPSPGPAGHRRRPAAAPALAAPAGGAASTTTSAFGQILRRRRSGGTLASSATPQAPLMARPINHSTTAGSNAGASPIAASAPSGGLAGLTANGHGPRHRIRLVPHIDSRRSLRFEPITRDVAEHDMPLRIGRFTDRSGMGVAAANALGSNKLAFKSKVVSRAHAEIWCETGGKFFIKDTKSSSGTFLNHVRLSAANQESRPYEVKDGDTLQLGVDYQGGTEDIYKCVRIRVEIGREWQNSANAFNTNALRQLKALAEPLQKGPGQAGVAPPKPSKKGTLHSGFGDCCICLFGVTIQQALFIAPCSHAFHYKCIRPLLETHHPAFSCPLCRTFADLEADVEVDIYAHPDEEVDEPDTEVAEAKEPETDVEEQSGTMVRRVRRVPVTGAQPYDVAEEQELEADEEDQDVMMVDTDEPQMFHREPSPVPADEGDGEMLVGEGSRSGSSVGEVLVGSSGEAMAMVGEGVDDRSVKRKR